MAAFISSASQWHSPSHREETDLLQMALASALSNTAICRALICYSGSRASAQMATLASCTQQTWLSGLLAALSFACLCPLPTGAQLASCQEDVDRVRGCQLTSSSHLSLELVTAVDLGIDKLTRDIKRHLNRLGWQNLAY